MHESGTFAKLTEKRLRCSPRCAPKIRRGPERAACAQGCRSLRAELTLLRFYGSGRGVVVLWIIPAVVQIFIYCACSLLLTPGAMA
jgi:hypothetical protein